MVAPVNMNEAPQRILSREETFLHYIARGGRWWLRWGMVACIIAIILCMVSPGFFFLAVAPAVLLLTLYILLVLTNEVERRSDSDAHRVLVHHETASDRDVIDDHAEDDQLAVNQSDIVKRETKIGLAIVGGVLLAALITAVVFLPGQVAAIGAFVFFAYLLFIAAPLWLGWLNDDIDIERRRQLDMPEPKQATTKETV